MVNHFCALHFQSLFTNGVGYRFPRFPPPSLPATESVQRREAKKGPKRVLFRVGGVLPPGVERTPKTQSEFAADPEYQDGLRRAEAARKRRADQARASRRRKEEGSGPAKPVLAPQSGGVAKGRPASRGPGGWRGPEKNWKCSQYDPP